MKRNLLKKALAAITVMALAFTGTPEGLFSGVAKTSAAANVTYGNYGKDLTWTLDEEGVLEISGKGEMESYSVGSGIIPWNNRRNDVKTVQINEGVKVISLSVFEDCARLNTIRIPSSATEICYGRPNDGYNDLKSIEVAEGNNAFCSVDGVLYDKNMEILICYGSGREAADFHIPESVTTIERYAFYRCRNLKTITIPDSVADIGENAFSYCSNLTNIAIPDGVTDLRYGLLRECSQLKSITLPKSVTHIENSIFEGCSALTDIQVAEDNPKFQAVDDILYDKDLKTLICYCSGKEAAEFQVPENVTSINPFAFNRCEYLTKITIPANLTSICIVSTNTFSVIENWNNLKTIEVAEENSAYQSVDGILYDKKLETLIYYGRGREAADFTIPDGVKTIGHDAFRGCKYLSRISIPDSVTGIASGCFRNCPALKNIETSQDNPQYCSIDGVLYNKTATTLVCCGGGKETSHFSIPQGVSEIENGAFYSCGNLSTVVMPDSVILIGSGAFCRCSNLKKIQLSKNLGAIRPAAFALCSELRSISFPADTQITLYNGAFWCCINLKSISIPENAVLYTSAFPYCSTDLTIYGVKGSTAETYARKETINFKDISEYIEESDETPTPAPGNEGAPSNPEENTPTPSPDGSDSKPSMPSPSPDGNDSKLSTPTPSPDINDSKPSTPTPSPDSSDGKPSTPTPSPDGNDSKPSTPSPSPDGSDSKLSTPTPSPSPSNSGVTPAKPDPKPGDALPHISKEEQEKNEWQLNKKVQSGWKGNSLSVHWSKVSKASGYDIYAAACSTDYEQITVSVKGQNKTTAKIAKIAGKRISKKATYKVIVRAYRMVNGKKQYIGTSADMHIAGSKNKKYTNAKSIKLPKKKVVLKKKKKAAIAARIVKQHRRKKLLSTAHGPRLRYTSSDHAVATVSKAGVLHAKKKGKCVICVRALNGISKQIKVTVK